MKSIRYSLMSILIILSVVLQSCTLGGAGVPYPENLQITDGVLDWNDVAGVDEYIVYIGSETYTITTSSLNLDTLPLEAGEYSVYIVAVQGNTRSKASVSLSYTKVRTYDEDVIEAILKKVDASYQLGMTQADLATSAEFNEYSSVLEFATNYASAAIEIELPKAKAIALIENTIDIQSNPLLNIGEAFEQYRIADVAGEDIAHIVLRLISNYDANIPAELQAILTEVYSDLDGYSAAFGVVVDYFLQSSTLLENETLLSAILFPENVIFTDEDVINLKNDIVVVLKAALPTAEQFAKTYKIMALFSNIIAREVALNQAPAELLESVEIANQYGQAIHVSLSLGLTFIEDLDVTTFTNMKTLLGNLEGATYDIKDDNGNFLYTVTETINMQSAVDLILLLENYVTTFATNHADLITEYESLAVGNLEAAWFNYVETLLLSTLTPDDPSYDVITMFFANIEDYKTISSITQRLEQAQFKHFIETQGKIALDLQQISLHMGYVTLAELKGDMDLLVQDLKEYQAIAETTLTKDDIVAMINLTISNTKMLTDDPIIKNRFTILKYIAPVISEVTYQYLLEGDELITAYETAFNLLVQNGQTSTEISEEVVLYTLDAYFTEENKALLNQSVTSIFTALHGSEVLPLLAITEEELNTLETTFQSELATFYQDLDTVVTYDFNNLTVEQQAKLDTLFTFLEFTW